MEERFTYLVVKFLEHDLDVASLCTEILNAGPRGPEYRFLYSLNLLGLDFLENAIWRFKTLTAMLVEKEGKLFDSAQWFESLGYASMGKVDSALVEMEKLKGIDNLFIIEEKVEEMKADLNKTKWIRVKRY